MARSGWIVVALLLVTGLLGALLLSHLLPTTKSTARSKDVPNGAVVLRNQTLPTMGGIPDQRVVTWHLGGKPEEASSGFYGVSIWQGGRQLYAHRARTGAIDLSVETGDFTGDGHDDVLVFDDTGGSGGCGVYRALATSAAEVRLAYVQLLCVDEGSIHLSRAGLTFRVGEAKNPRTAGDIHCCYLFVRRTVKRWNGRRLVTIRTARQPLKGSFPGRQGDFRRDARSVA